MADERLQQRLTAVEELLTHFERVVTDLNSVVLLQQRRIEALESGLARLTTSLDGLATTLPTPPPDAVADRPPHY